MAIIKNAVIFSMMVMALCCGVTMARIAPAPQEAPEETYDLPTINNVERQVVLVPGESDCDSESTGTGATKVVQIPQEEADCDSAPEETNEVPTHAINNVKRQQAVLIPGDGDCDSAPAGAGATKIVPTPPKKTQSPQEEADCDSSSASVGPVKVFDKTSEDLPRLLVRPTKIVLDFQKGKAIAPVANDLKSGEQDRNEDFVVELSVTLVDARKLFYIYGKANPYDVLSMGDQIIRSKRNSQTTVFGPPGEPIWNQDFLFVANPRKQMLYIQVKDSLGFADISIGTGEVDLSSTDRIVKLQLL